MRTLLDKFAANLKRFRTAHNLSQAELAQKAGLSVSYISLLEHGERSPRIDTIQRFSEALKKPPAALLS
jgi:transcriptional regulator with XRE-family HTH domain